MFYCFLICLFYLSLIFFGFSWPGPGRGRGSWCTTTPTDALGFATRTSWCLFVAYAHTVFARFCELKSLMRRYAATPNAVNSCSSLRPIVANAHTMFDRCCDLKSFKRHSAAVDDSLNS